MLLMRTLTMQQIERYPSWICLILILMTTQALAVAKETVMMTVIALPVSSASNARDTRMYLDAVGAERGAMIVSIKNRHICDHVSVVGTSVVT